MKKTQHIVTLVLALSFIAATATHAEIGLNTATGVDLGVNRQKSVEAHAQIDASIQTRAHDRSSQEIERRIAALQKIDARIDTMKRVSDTNKSSIKGSIDTQISTLTALKAKIATDTDATALKADVESITKSYRIFMLVIPQGEIMATTDRITTTADLMTNFGTKLQARISAAQTSGIDVSGLQTRYTDYGTQIATAKTDAQAALSLTVNLTPDNGDKATIEANKRAITEARAKIKAGIDALKAARADAEIIVKGLKGFNPEVHATTKTSASTTTR